MWRFAVALILRRGIRLGLILFFGFGKELAQIHHHDLGIAQCAAQSPEELLLPIVLGLAGFLLVLIVQQLDPLDGCQIFDIPKARNRLGISQQRNISSACSL